MPSQSTLASTVLPDLLQTRREGLALEEWAYEKAPPAYNGDEATQAQLRQVEEVDDGAAKLWGMTEEELAEIQRSLEELRR